jgi:hypothetical protein
MISKDHLNSLFNSIDQMNIDAFLAFLSDNALFRFGNADPVSGKDVIRDVLQGFFASIKTLQHNVLESWTSGNALACHGFVTYTRHDSSTLAVPFANIMKFDGNLIHEYLIFIDVSELYNYT